MARPRRTPRTPFGRWLDGWLDEHPEKTLEALGVDIAQAVGREKPLTDGAISQWLSGATRRIDLENLRGLSIVTGEPFENLEVLVYGGGTRPPAQAAEVSPEFLDAIEDRMRKAFREEMAAWESRQPPPATE